MAAVNAPVPNVEKDKSSSGIFWMLLTMLIFGVNVFSYSLKKN